MSNSRFEISNLKIMTSWRHNLPLNNDCTICRCSLNENSIDYQNKGITSFIVVGNCDHAFHKECLDSWIKNNMRCPICGVSWTFKNNNFTD